MPQHNILGVILPAKDSHVPQMKKSNRTRSPQRDSNTQRSIHAEQREFTLHNLSSCEVFTWFIRPKDKNAKLSCQKHKKYVVYSHTGVNVPQGYSPQIKQEYNKITPDPHG